MEGSDRTSLYRHQGVQGEEQLLSGHGEKDSDENELLDLPPGVVRAVDLRPPPTNRWLVEDYVGDESCVVVGAAPKSYKTWLGLTMTVAVASGRPFLDRPVQQGRVLGYFAEDAEWMVRERLASICRSEDLALEDLDLYMVKDAALHINVEAHRERLRESVATLRPRLVVLDPFVRIVAGIDENNSTQVSSVLGFLRSMSREFECAVVLAHHTRKSARRGRAAEALRGSGDFFAWPDSVISLKRIDDQGHATVEVEHRFAHAPMPLVLQLDADAETQTHLAVAEMTPPEGSNSTEDNLEAKALEAIRSEKGPMTNETLRGRLQCRMKRLIEALRSLESEGVINRPTRQGWVAVTDEADDSGA